LSRDVPTEAAFYIRDKAAESIEDIMRNATAQLNMIPQEAFQKCFQQWQDRWKKYYVTVFQVKS
jgi:hypothetical protein